MQCITFEIRDGAARRRIFHLSDNYYMSSSFNFVIFESRRVVSFSISVFILRHKFIFLGGLNR